MNAPDLMSNRSKKVEKGVGGRGGTRMARTFVLERIWPLKTKNGNLSPCRFSRNTEAGFPQFAFPEGRSASDHVDSQVTERAELAPIRAAHFPGPGLALGAEEAAFPLEEPIYEAA